MNAEAYGFEQPTLKDQEFALFQKLIYDAAGINMSPAKKALVSGRLAKRLKHFGLTSYADYFQLLKTNPNGEMQTAVDLLTTNETFFFREPKHFEFLRNNIINHWGSSPRRIWSAASSSGEEAYTLAMVLAEYAPSDQWEIVGTDISTRMVEKAQAAHYPLARSDGIPKAFLSKYCLKGTGSQEGTLLIDRKLRNHTQFLHANLRTDLSRLGLFDVIFLRNVLIYFDMETKQQVVTKVAKQLKPDGYLVISHSESLHGITDQLKVVVPSIYRRS